MNSKIYACKLWHERLKPAKNSFNYNIFMWYLDLDELDDLSNFKLISKNKRNVFGFYDEDHFKFLKLKNQLIAKEKINYNNSKYFGKNTKDKIKIMVDELKLGFEVDKVFLLTNLRQFGYVFNPVSFYYCFDKRGDLKAMFSEVNNTFHDQKMYYVNIENPNQKIFTDKQRKNYYISPFIDYDNDLCWKFNIPKQKLIMNIDSVKEDIVLKTTLTGIQENITGVSTFSLIFRYPLMTFMIIFLIHYQALKLWMKKVKFYRKTEVDTKIMRDLK